VASPRSEHIVSAIIGLRMGSGIAIRDYDLVFTDRRVIAAMVTSAIPFPGVIGVGQALGSMLERDENRARLAQLAPELILRDRRANFAIGYPDVLHVKYRGGNVWQGFESLEIVVRGHVYQFMRNSWKRDRTRDEHARNLLSRTFGNRLDFKEG